MGRGGSRVRDVPLRSYLMSNLSIGAAASCVSGSGGFVEVGGSVCAVNLLGGGRAGGGGGVNIVAFEGDVHQGQELMFCSEVGGGAGGGSGRRRRKGKRKEHDGRQKEGGTDAEY